MLNINLNENNIIEELKNNNFTNFSFIFNKYYRKVYFLSVKMLKNTDLAEELTQDVFIDVLFCVKNLKYNEYFESWLTKITLNKANNKIKDIINEKSKNCNIDITNFLEINNENFYPEEVFLKNEFSNELLKEINSLDDNKKNVLLMFYFYNFSLKKISEIENIPIGTVKSRLFSAKKILSKRKTLKNLFFIFLIMIFIPNITININHIYCNTKYKIERY